MRAALHSRGFTNLQREDGITLILALAILVLFSILTDTAVTM